MEAITNQLQNLEISKDSLSGKDLTIERQFLYNFKVSFLNVNFEQKIEILHRVQRYCMYLFFDSQSALNHSDASILVEFTEVSFGQEKILREVGWCANYLMDKRQSSNFHLHFLFSNHSPNCKIVDHDQTVLRYAACNCFPCKPFN